MATTGPKAPKVQFECARCGRKVDAIHLCRGMSKRQAWRAEMIRRKAAGFQETDR